MKKVLLCLAGLALLTACNEEPDPVIQQIPDYFPLSVGNYWIYDHYEVMETGEERILERSDSIYIEKDTLIGSEVYYVIKGSSFLCGHFFSGKDYQIIRDSVGYLVNEDGQILMSSVCFDEPLGEYIYTMPDDDTLYTGSYSMQTEPALVNVPAGEFDVINCRAEIIVYDEDSTRVRYTDNLYHAGAIDIVEVVCQLDDDCHRALLVGHNPGMIDLLEYLTGTSQPFPTAALAHLELAVGNWRDTELTTRATLLGLWRPRDLP